MKRTALSALCALTLASPVLAPREPTASAGPGGVFYAVRDLLAALDRADAEHLRAAFVAERRGFEIRPATDGEIATAERALAPFEFWDRAPDGTAIAARSLDAVLAGAKSLADAQRGRPTSTITSFVGDCPSEDCLWGIVEFERVWGEGDDARRVPMRATALVRWVGGEGPPLRLLHWHASPR